MHTQIDHCAGVVNGACCCREGEDDVVVLPLKIYAELVERESNKRFEISTYCPNYLLIDGSFYTTLRVQSFTAFMADLRQDIILRKFGNRI